MKPQNKEEISNKYNEESTIWLKFDKWHWHTYEAITRFVNSFIKECKLENWKILNAGSGGNNYSFSEENTYHLDLAYQRIKEKKNYVIGSIEAIPFEKETFDLVFCVGSVLNYADPALSIMEFSRVCKSSAYLVIEFENSYTFELMLTSDFNKKATLRRTFYKKKEEIIWYYSENYIASLLKEYGYKIIKTRRIHLLSTLVYRITKSENFSAFFGKLDSFICRIPIIGKLSSNVILIAQKVN